MFRVVLARYNMSQSPAKLMLYNPISVDYHEDGDECK